MDDKTVSYTDPTVLWQLHHPADGRTARATIIPGSPTSTLVFFVDDQFERGENFDEWDVAIAHANAVRDELLTEGWQEAN